MSDKEAGLIILKVDQDDDGTVDFNEVSFATNHFALVPLGNDS